MRSIMERLKDKDNRDVTCLYCIFMSFIIISFWAGLIIGYRVIQKPATPMYFILDSDGKAEYLPDFQVSK